jgi:hypothetical protein
LAGDVYSIIRRLLEVDFTALWESSGNGWPVELVNVPFVQPTTGQWIRLAVLIGAGHQASLGSAPREFISGAVIVNIFSPKGSGTRQVAHAAGLVADGLRYRQVAGDGVVVDLYAPSIMGGDAVRKFYQQNVSVEFRANHVTG